MTLNKQRYLKKRVCIIVYIYVYVECLMFVGENPFCFLLSQCFVQVPDTRELSLNK